MPAGPLPTLAAAAYTDPARWTRERAAIFGESWLCVGHEAELPAPGDAVVFEVAGWSLLLVRQADGEVVGLHNVCRHRAAPVVWPGSRPRGLDRLQCRYHGWCYDRGGRFTAAPGFGAPVPGGLDLHRVAVARWRGLLFAWPGTGTPADFAAWIGPLEAAAPTLDTAGLALHGRATHDLACNWKVYVENYQEGYHIPWLHPSLAQEVSTRAYEVVPGPRHVLHRVPKQAAGPNAGLWAWLWPSLALNVYGDGVSVERIVPEGVARTRIDYLYLFRPGVDPGGSLDMSDRVTREDQRICEAVQRGLESGAYDRGVLSPRHEAGVARFQALVRAAVPEG